MRGTEEGIEVILGDEGSFALERILANYNQSVFRVVESFFRSKKIEEQAINNVQQFYGSQFFQYALTSRKHKISPSTEEL